MNESELASLIERARNHEPDALAAVYEGFYPKVVKFMYYRVNEADAEDLTAEVFVKVLANIHKQTGLFLPWLYRIASNVVNDYLRYKKVRKDKTPRPSSDSGLIYTYNPADEVDRKADISRALKDISEDQRELIVLKFIQGLSNNDIAEITGKTLVGIRALQYRALKSLRSILGEKEENNV